LHQEPLYPRYRLMQERPNAAVQPRSRAQRENVGWNLLLATPPRTKRCL
jgi:hypothetical protein